MRRVRLKAAIGFLRGPHLGSVLAIALAFWSGVLFAGPPVGLNESEWSQYVGWIVAGALTSAGYTVFRLTRENLGLRARFEPKVRIVHVQRKKPYYVREAQIGNGVIERRHLVGIINDSGVKISGIRVVAEKFEPYQQGATWIDAALNPLRGTANNGGWFDLTVGDGAPTQYVEVLQELKGVPGTTDPILAYIYNSSGLQELRRYVSGDWFAIVLRLEGDLKPCRFKLVAHRNAATRWFDVLEGNLSVETMSEAGPSDYQMITLSVVHPEAPSQ